MLSLIRYPILIFAIVLIIVSHFPCILINVRLHVVQPQIITKGDNPVRKQFLMRGSISLTA